MNQFIDENYNSSFSNSFLKMNQFICLSQINPNELNGNSFMNENGPCTSSHEGFLQKFPRLGGIITQRGAGKRVENYGGVAFAPSLARFVEWMKRKERRKERRRRRASE